LILPKHPKTVFQDAEDSKKDSSKKKKVRLASQIAINDFWSRFVTKNPILTAIIFPPALYENLLPYHISADEAGASHLLMQLQATILQRNIAVIV
jgi:hypothetical protein